MKKIFTILILSSLFAGELEVEGDLKVSGNIDAQNNPIKNVGIPQELTDAINGNVLQDALRDDTQYEYRMYLTRMHYTVHEKRISYFEYQQGIPLDASSAGWGDNFHDEFFSLSADGWKIDQIIDYTYSGGSTGSDAQYIKQLIIFKRPLEE